jgi:uncharacterized delta-60 repeat protein
MATIVGTERPNTLRGTPQADVIVAKGGNDLILGAGGNDVICAGSGNDRVQPGAGNDTILGGTGNDVAVASLGNDRLNGEKGLDVLGGGAGTDVISGQPGDDLLLGGTGADTCTAGIGDDIGSSCENTVGDLFGPDGRVLVADDDQGTIQNPIGLAVDGDGAVVVAGGQYIGVGAWTMVAVARLAPDGTPDSSFSTDGIAAFPGLAGSTSAHAEAAVLDGDGRLLVGGTATIERSDHFLLARLLVDGTLDPTFGEGGVVTSPFPGTHPNGFDYGEGLVDLLLLDGGRVLAVGSQVAHGDIVPALALYDEDGVLDPTFGDGGLALVTDLLSADAGDVDEHMPFAAALDAEGRILLGGSTVQGTNANHLHGTVLRLLDDGQLDATFGGGDGEALLEDADGFTRTEGRGLTVQPDGGILLTGSTYAAPASGPADAFVSRVDDDGVDDDAFGDDGVVRFDINDGANSADYGADVAVDPDGKVLVAGVGGPGGSEWVVRRFTPSGESDETFGLDGSSVAVSNPIFDVLYPPRLALQDDGRFFLAGYSAAGNVGGNGMLVVRHAPDGSIVA